MHERTDEEGNNFTLLRLSLALMVVFGHFRLLNGVETPPFPFNLADAAVDSFFVVSGYLIAGSYERSRGTVPFYARRVFRLLPMYWFVVLVQALLMMLMLPRGPLSQPIDTLLYLAANLSFANFLHYDIGGVLNRLTVPGINPSLWTLKIEMAFYLIVPLIWTAVRRWGWPVLAALFVASAIYYAAMSDLGAFRYAKQLPGQLQFFVVGMALYRYGDRIRVPLPVALLIVIGFFPVWTVFDPIPPALCPIVVGAFVFCAALRLPVVPMRSDMSYSVYLLHGPLIQTALLTGLYRDRLWWLALLVAAVLSLSFLTEHLIERPGNAFGKRLSKLLAAHGRSAQMATVAAPEPALVQH